ncbi:MAG: hypothetical protein ACTHN5_20505 [Phycisphaerae bacterium]
MTEPHITPANTGFSLPAPPSPRKPRRWLAAILIFFVFIAGLLCGTGLTIALAVHRLRYALHHPEEVPARLTAILDKRLHLSPEQRTKVESLIAQRQSHLQKIRREVQPQVQAELEGLHTDISALLTPDQQPKWDHVYTDAIHTWMPAAQ